MPRWYETEDVFNQNGDIYNQLTDRENFGIMENIDDLPCSSGKQYRSESFHTVIAVNQAIEQTDVEVFRVV